VVLNPVYVEALLNLAISYNDLGRYADARDAFARAGAARGNAEQPGDAFALGKIANLHAGVAQAYADLGRLAEAATELEKAVRLRPEFVDLRVKLASVYRDQGKFADAERELLAACEQNPAYTKARILLGVTLLATGRRDEAATRFREVLDIDPLHKAAKMYLRFAERPPGEANAASDQWAAPADDGETFTPE
jgi:tetratricopeptide (TPR) repeat protein